MQNAAVRLGRGLGAASAAMLAMCAAANAAPAADPLHFGPSYGSAVSKLPDWRGIWLLTGGGAFDPATADPPGSNPNTVPTMRIHPPYNKEWEAKYQARIDAHKAGFFTDPITACTPNGFPRVLGGLPFDFEIITTPTETWMIWEYMSQVRRIYTDGRPHPAPEDLWPQWMGNSIGHWEGDVLAIDTISVKANVLDRSEAPHSDKMHTTEHWRMIDHNTLEDQIVLEDPVAFTKPWHVTRRYKRQPADTRLDDIYCAEGNERNPVVNGQTQVILPGDKPGYVLGAAPDKEGPPKPTDSNRP